MGCGARGDSQPPASPLKLYGVRFRVAWGAGDTRAAWGSARGPGAGELSPAGGQSGSDAGVASVALCLRRRLRFGFDVCESWGRLRRRLVCFVIKV